MFHLRKEFSLRFSIEVLCNRDSSVNIVTSISDCNKCPSLAQSLETESETPLSRNDLVRCSSNWVWSGRDSKLTAEFHLMQKFKEVKPEVCRLLGCYAVWRNTLMMEVLRSSETSVLTRVTRHNIPDDSILHSHRRGNLKSRIDLTGWPL
jgi:hypothetical protein